MNTFHISVVTLNSNGYVNMKPYYFGENLFMTNQKLQDEPLNMEQKGKDSMLTILFVFQDLL